MTSNTVWTFNHAMHTTKRIRPRHRTLKAWREATALSQRDAARLLGLSQPGYGKIELGQRHPRPALLKRIIQTTGVSVEVLTGIA